MTNLIRHDAVAVINDLHMGDATGAPRDEFNRDAEFEELLGDVIPGELGWPATLIVAGDLIDFTQVLPERCRHRLGPGYGATQGESLEKIERVIACHPRVFASLAEFLDRGGQVLVLPGNHDIDFHWPAVFSRFRAAAGGAREGRLRFVAAGAVHERGLYVEHGNQYTRDNRFRRWREPIVAAPDGPRLERPWGTLFMELVYTELFDLHPYVYRLTPRLLLTRTLTRSLFDPDGISRRSLSQMVPFFFQTGVGPFGRRFVTPTNAARLRHLLTTVEARVFALAHTHQASNDARAVRGRAPRKRLFNTGSWIGRFPIGEGESPHWRDLRERQPQHDLRYLAISLRGDFPYAALKSLALRDVMCVESPPSTRRARHASRAA